MTQAKFSLDESQIKFLEHHKMHGFKDKSALVRSALDRLQAEMELQQIKESAELYAEVYAEEEELGNLTETALEGWPE